MEHGPITFPDWKQAHVRADLHRSESLQIHVHVMKKPGLGVRSPLDDADFRPDHPGKL